MSDQQDERLDMTWRLSFAANCAEDNIIEGHAYMNCGGHRRLSIFLGRGRTVFFSYKLGKNGNWIIVAAMIVWN